MMARLIPILTLPAHLPGTQQRVFLRHRKSDAAAFVVYVTQLVRGRTKCYINAIDAQGIDLRIDFEDIEYLEAI